MKFLSTMILGAGLATSLQASEFDKSSFDLENTTILVSVDEAAKTETVYAVKDFEMLSDEASKEELDSLVASGDAEILETVIEASDSEFDAMSSQEAWGWFSSLFNSRYNRGNRDPYYGRGSYNGRYRPNRNYGNANLNFSYRYGRYGHNGYQNGYYGYGDYRFNYRYNYRRGSRRFYCYY